MFGSDSNEHSRPVGLLARGRKIIALLIRMVQNRLAIAATGIQEEYERLWPLLVRTVISFVLLAFGLFFLSLLVVVYFWDSYRLEALAAVAAFYLISGSLVALHVYQLWGNRHKLFSTTIEELEKDIESLED